MCFGDLYDYIQTLEVPISRTDVRAKIRDLLPTKPFRLLVSGLNVDMMLGYYVSARNTEHPFVKQAGTAVIVIARENNERWRRIVEFKELMHLFDDPWESTNNADELESLLIGMCENVETHRTEQMQSEIECLWMAFAICCPEEKRVELQQRRSDEEILDSGIAELLRIPERWVPFLFVPEYKDNIGALIRKSRQAR